MLFYWAVYIIIQTRSHNCIQETTTTTDNDGACLGHQREQIKSGACITAVTKEEDCSENISMACASVVRIFV